MSTQPVTLTPDQVEFANPQQVPQSAPPVTLTSDQVEFASPGSGDTTAYSDGKPSNPVIPAGSIPAGGIDRAGDFINAVAPFVKGAAKSAGQTLNTLSGATPFSRPFSEQQTTENGTQEKIGGGLESVLEFIGGDEGLKGLSLAERLGVSAKIMKALEDHPVLAKLANAGVSALRQGTVGAAQGAAHGATAGNAAVQGLTAGAVAGMTTALASGLKRSIQDRGPLNYMRGHWPPPGSSTMRKRLKLRRVW